MPDVTVPQPLFPDGIRESLHTDAENFDVYCERCKRVHKHFTMTREDYDGIIAKAARTLSDAIDAQIAADVYAQWSGNA